MSNVETFPLGPWRATGRWRVQRFLAPRGGPMGRPAWRWAVIGPRGEHRGSSPEWPRALGAAQLLARECGAS